MHTPIYTHVHALIQTHIVTYSHMYILTYTYSLAQIQLHGYTHTHTNIHSHIFSLTHRHTQSHIHTLSLILTKTHIVTYTYPHTYSHPLPPSPHTYQGQRWEGQKEGTPSYVTGDCPPATISFPLQPGPVSPFCPWSTPRGLFLPPTSHLQPDLRSHRT